MRKVLERYIFFKVNIKILRWIRHKGGGGKKYKILLIEICQFYKYIIKIYKNSRQICNKLYHYLFLDGKINLFKSNIHCPKIRNNVMHELLHSCKRFGVRK